MIKPEGIKMDYYDILGISRNSTYEEIKTKYRELVKKYHPDLNGGTKESEERFKKIVEAYEVLSEEKKNENKYIKNDNYRQRYETKRDYRNDNYNSNTYKTYTSYKREYDKRKEEKEHLYTTATEKQVKFAKFLLFRYGKEMYSKNQIDYLWKILKLEEVPLYVVKRVIDDLNEFVD